MKELNKWVVYPMAAATIYFGDTPVIYKVGDVFHIAPKGVADARLLNLVTKPGMRTQGEYLEITISSSVFSDIFRGPRAL